MIHARIDTVEDRKIVGFEVGNRTLYDKRFGGDPLWIFVDSFRVRYRVDFSHFILYPTLYEVTPQGDIVLSQSAIPGGGTVPDGHSLLLGADGNQLTGADAQYLYGEDPE